MRIGLTIIVAAGAVLALGACGGGERANIIANAEAECVSSFPANAPGINVQRLCGCVVTAISEGKSEAELKELYKAKGPPPGAQAAVGQCMEAEAKAAGK